ncbi:hypothetical protein OIU84_010090 [Salix udensis]|uniref:Uncharacterized protein n=1 Tax=Salix udensis TaxID=889485 RepID=A0AAD6JJX8_9ROSI|nr:hypothetical protein OIU84_010090 [Salix udensis]
MESGGPTRVRGMDTSSFRPLFLFILTGLKRSCKYNLESSIVNGNFETIFERRRWELIALHGRGGGRSLAAVSGCPPSTTTVLSLQPLVFFHRFDFLSAVASAAGFPAPLRPRLVIFE